MVIIKKNESMKAAKLIQNFRMVSIDSRQKNLG